MPSTAVFDASFAMMLLVPHPLREAAHRIHDQLRADHVAVIAPTLWLYEITSSLQKLAYFKQISAAQVETALSLAEQFGITLIAPDFSLAR
jgi:predicted nucleic acid-binding protein